MTSAATPEITGFATFTVNGKQFKTWYIIFGDLKSGQTPLVTLHGGPGMGHHCMVVHKQLWVTSRIPVICYDQLGNGQSTNIRDAPKEFWTPELFMDELENLLQHLGISDNFFLVGHSWGGMLGGQFAAARQPKGLKRLIINNSHASMALFIQGINDLLKGFPPDYVAMLRRHEAAGTTDSKEYKDGLMLFAKKHICTLDPWPEPLIASFKTLEQNPTFHNLMQVHHNHLFGPSEFCIEGSLKDWSIIDIIHNIKCETLLTSGPQDEVQEVSILPWFLKVPKIKWVELANSTHLGMYEEEARYIRVITSFLTA